MDEPLILPCRCGAQLEAHPNGGPSEVPTCSGFFEDRPAKPYRALQKAGK